MKVHKVTYLSGQPALDTMTIDISEGISIQLSFEQYCALSQAIDERNHELIKEVIVFDERFEKKRKAYNEAIEDIRNLFYKPVGENGYFSRKDPADITEEELSQVLEKHNTFLGLE